jgi:hypothetical protein
VSFAGDGAGRIGVQDATNCAVAVRFAGDGAGRIGVQEVANRAVAECTDEFGREGRC